MAAIFALLAAMLGWASPVLAGDASQNPASNLNLAQVGKVLPPIFQKPRADRATIILNVEDVVASVRCR